MAYNNSTMLQDFYDNGYNSNLDNLIKQLVEVLKSGNYTLIRDEETRNKAREEINSKLQD